MKVLAIIDAQTDFINGSLAVGLEPWQNAKAEIIKLSQTNNYDWVIFTRDWHPSNHCSFVQQGGPWPKHCVQKSKGAEIDHDLLKLISEIPNSLIISKGQDVNQEEYGVDLLQNFKEVDTSTSVDVVGLCFDYCVAECARITKEKHPEVSVKIHKAASVAIDKTAKPNVGLVEII